MQRRDKLITISVCFLALMLAISGTVPCLWRTAFGIPCPGCGMSRAYSALLTGNIAIAWQQHPLFWLPPVVLGLCLFKKGAAASLWLWIPVAILLLGTYLVRIVMFFPDQPPMDYLSHNLFQAMIERIYIQ